MLYPSIHSMKTELLKFSEHYETELHTLLKNGKPIKSNTILALADEAHASGLKAQGFARFHERTLRNSILPTYPEDQKKRIITRAGTFFARIANHYANAPPTHSAPTQPARFIEALSRRNGELSQQNQTLLNTIHTLQASEKARLNQVLPNPQRPTKSDLHKIELRNLSRQILLTQEEERKRISRELHDVIAQALIAVKVHLATLKKEAHLNLSSLNQNIQTTQRLVARSARIVHQFARELRPMALDDLGLAPAIESYLNQYRKRTGIRLEVQMIENLEALDSIRRTVLFRVVQEALTNVDRHANASKIKIKLTLKDNCVILRIADNGRSFRVENYYPPRGNTKHLGLLGMRERIEMVGGHLHIESTQGIGTTVMATVPILQNLPG